MSVSAHVEAWLKAHRDEVIGWRRHIHSHPELSNQEFQTTEFIAGILRAHGLTPQLFPNTGLMVDIGAAGDGRIAFRADIDALPVTEVTGLEFSSLVDGVSHSCGHDVHVTIALALACALAEVDAAGELPIGVRVIFQPAEEVINGGAEETIALGALDGVAAIFAVHAEPKLRVGKVGVRAGAITSATDIVEIDVFGTGGHTSRPHLSADVVYGLGALATQLPGLLSRRVDPRTGTVLVFGQIESGYAPNAIPERGSISGTLRTADIKVWRQIQPLFEQLVAQVLEPTGCGHNLRYLRGVPPVLNDDAATALLASAVKNRDPQAVVQAPQSSGGEDFSWYLEHVPGAMARLGCWSGEGDRQDLHQGDLLVDERSIGVGVQLFAGIIDEYTAQPTD